MKLPPMFEDCVGDEDANFRYASLNRPFLIGDHAYATSGVIAVRTPRREDFDIPERHPDERPRISDEWFQGHESTCEGTWHPLPESIPMEKCPECGEHTLPKPDPISVGPVLLNPAYVKTLLKHGIKAVRVASPKEACYFQSTCWEGDTALPIEGLLMPMKDEA
jgi:hypothetical protein